MQKKKQTQKDPIATIAFYGPDNQRCTKVVVAIIKNKRAEPDPIKRWVSGVTDARGNEKILSEIETFVQEHNAASVISSDGIIGCPTKKASTTPKESPAPSAASGKTTIGSRMKKRVNNR